MKFLLTSAGITNKSIAKALFELTQKKPQETTVAFIPTASNAEEGDKLWLIEDLISLKELQFKSIEITDISAVDETIWKASLKRADVIYFEGGNDYHLMHWLNKTKLNEELKILLQDKVYVGISAGSIVVGPSLQSNIFAPLYDEEAGLKEIKSLQFTDFYILPHLNSPYFKKVTENNIKKISFQLQKTIYALDDNSAIKINNDEIEIISEGEYAVFNE